MLSWQPGWLLRHRQRCDWRCKVSPLALHCVPAASDALVVLQGTNPIYNLLPDIFSSLSAETQLPSAHFQVSQKPCSLHLMPACSENQDVVTQHSPSYLYNTIVHQSSTEKPQDLMPVDWTPGQQNLSRSCKQAMAPGRPSRGCHWDLPEQTG